MEKTRMFACAGVADANAPITYYPMATAENGFEKFEISCAAIEKGGSTPWQALENQEYMVLALEGSLRFTNRKDQYFDLGPGEVLLIGPGEEFEMVNTAAGQTKYMFVRTK